MLLKMCISGRTGLTMTPCASFHTRSQEENVAISQCLWSNQFCGFLPSRDTLFGTGKWDGSFCSRISCSITKLKEARRSLLQRAGSFWMAALLLVHAWNMRTDRYDWKNVSLLYVTHFLTSSCLFFFNYCNHPTGVLPELGPAKSKLPLAV